MAEGLTRRQALAAAAIALVWTGPAQARVSADRVRPGGELTLRCSGATAFELRLEGGSTLRVDAPIGIARLRAPRPAPARRGWATLRCQPLVGHRRLGAPLAVQVLAASPVYGM